MVPTHSLAWTLSSSANDMAAARFKSQSERHVSIQLHAFSLKSSDSATFYLNLPVWPIE